MQRPQHVTPMPAITSTKICLQGERLKKIKKISLRSNFRHHDILLLLVLFCLFYPAEM